MRQVTGLKLAAICGAMGLMGMVGTSFGQTVVNGDFSQGTAGVTSGTDTVATGWTLNPAVGDNYTNPGDRCTFGSPSPSGSAWSFWEQTFVQDGSATQTITSGITAGTTYTMSTNMQFQLGNGAAGDGFNGVTLANQASDTKSQDTGDLYAYVEMQYLNGHGANLGSPVMTTIAAGSIPATGTLSPWIPESVSGVAPAGAAGVELILGWQNGGLDGGTGGQQSAFATDVTLSVPEP
ncbi:MAG TPA: hypothetical protein VGG19_10610, partial [Tepidisphaeraceae bacterium]